MPCHCICCVHAAMLAARASKIYIKAVKASFNIVFNSNIHHIKNTVQKFGHFCLLLQVINHFFIAACFAFHAFHAPGI